jgi:hypothetical protein
VLQLRAEFHLQQEIKLVIRSLYLIIFTVRF